VFEPRVIRVARVAVPSSPDPGLLNHNSDQDEEQEDNNNNEGSEMDLDDSEILNDLPDETEVCFHIAHPLSLSACFKSTFIGHRSRSLST
jgi:hypothetical protein